MEKDLKGILVEELHDILSSEEQIIKALPTMVSAAGSPDLKKAFETHLKETRGQVQRLTKIFKILKIKKVAKFCKGTKGLIDECKEVLQEIKIKSPVRDALLIAKAQRIEHYEMAAYGTVRTYAKELGLRDVANLLQETLNEEGNADKKMTKIAEGGLFTTGVNQKAIKPQAAKPRILKKSPIKTKKTVAAKPKKAVTARSYPKKALTAKSHPKKATSARTHAKKLTKRPSASSTKRKVATARR